MGKKSRGNVYCDSCKKFHRRGKCNELSPKELSNVTANTVMALMMRATKGVYLSRDLLGDVKDFNESDFVKEDGEGGIRRNSKENK